jgi:hypothetical protein
MLQNKKTVIINKPKHAPDVLDKHANGVRRHDKQEQRLTTARLAQKTVLEAAVTAGNAEALLMSLASLKKQDQRSCMPSWHGSAHCIG